MFLVWVDDIVIWGKTPVIVSNRLLAILDCLLERGLLLQPTRPSFFERK